MKLRGTLGWLTPAAVIAFAAPATAQGDFGASVVAEYNRLILTVAIFGAIIGTIIIVGLETVEHYRLLSSRTADWVWGLLGSVSFAFLAVTAIWKNEYRFLLIGMFVSAIAYQVTSAIKRSKRG